MIEKIMIAMKQLPQRSRNIVFAKMQGHTLVQIAERHDLSCERVRTIVLESIEEVRKWVNI